MNEKCWRIVEYFSAAVLAVSSVLVILGIL